MDFWQKCFQNLFASNARLTEQRSTLCFVGHRSRVQWLDLPDCSLLLEREPQYFTIKVKNVRMINEYTAYLVVPLTIQVKTLEGNVNTNFRPGFSSSTHILHPPGILVTSNHLAETPGSYRRHGTRSEKCVAEISLYR